MKKHQFRKIHNNSVRQARVCGIWTRKAPSFWVWGVSTTDLLQLRTKGFLSTQLAAGGLSSLEEDFTFPTHSAPKYWLLRLSPRWVQLRSGDSLLLRNSNVEQRSSTLSVAYWKYWDDSPSLVPEAEVPCQEKQGKPRGPQATVCVSVHTCTTCMHSCTHTHTQHPLPSTQLLEQECHSERSLLSSAPEFRLNS